MDRACSPGRRNDRPVRTTPSPQREYAIVPKADGRKRPAPAGFQPCRRAPAVWAYQCRPQRPSDLGMQRLLRFASRFGLAHQSGAFRSVRKRRPCGFGPAATIAHVLERRRICIRPRFIGAGKQEFQVRGSNDRRGQDYSACNLFAGSTSASAVSGCGESSADLRFTALILPRLSCWRS